MANETVKIQRKNALEMSELIRMYISSMKLTSGLNAQRVFAAWDEASGAGDYTLRKYVRGGTLYVTLGSSVVRSRLRMTKEALIEKINGILLADGLFTADDQKVSLIKDIVFK